MKNPNYIPRPIYIVMLALFTALSLYHLVTTL